MAPTGAMDDIKPPTKLIPDGRVVGTDAIFASSNVHPPSNVERPRDGDTVPLPPEDDGIPTPSVYCDDRGEIHNVKVNNKHRLNILYTKAGYMRSGDLHTNKQCDFIFSGKVRIWTLAKDGSTAMTTFGDHEYVEIPRGVPHVFEFLEDTVMAEWWEPQGFQAWFYAPYRDIVNRCMLERGQSSDTDGKKKGLVVLGPLDVNRQNNSKIVLGVVAIGMAAVGFLVGSRSGKRL